MVIRDLLVIRDARLIRDAWLIRTQSSFTNRHSPTIH
jgi:hypothetical protein